MRFEPVKLIQFIVCQATEFGASLTPIRVVKFLYLADLYHARCWRKERVLDQTWEGLRETNKEKRKRRRRIVVWLGCVSRSVSAINNTERPKQVLHQAAKRRRTGFPVRVRYRVRAARRNKWHLTTTIGNSEYTIIEKNINYDIKYRMGASDA